MKKNNLGKTDIMVSEICLGTMTWGQQNSEKEAHDQLSFAIERGINFIDTAEMYSVPPKEETYGLTEKYIGTWLKNQDRSRIILATKIAGRTSNVPSGPPGLDCPAPPAPTVIGYVCADTGNAAGPFKGLPGKVNGAKVGEANLNPPAPPPPPASPAARPGARARSPWLQRWTPPCAACPPPPVACPPPGTSPPSPPPSPPP